MTTERELAGRGYKLTRQRRELLQALQKSDYLLTAEELHQRVVSSQPALSLSTVYRNLDLLTSLGLVCKLDLGDGQARYEAPRSTAHHHHLICLGCGLSEHLDCPLPGLDALAARSRFRVTSHRFEVYGYCANCQQD